MHAAPGTSDSAAGAGLHANEEVVLPRARHTLDRTGNNASARVAGMLAGLEVREKKYGNRVHTIPKQVSGVVVGPDTYET